MSFPAHVLWCPPCSLTFPNKDLAQSHMHSARHEPERHQVLRQHGLAGERAWIARMISVLLLPDAATLAAIKALHAPSEAASPDKYAAHTAYLSNVLTRLNAAPAPLRIDIRVHLMRPQRHALAHAAALPASEHYFRLTLALHPVLTRAELLSAVAGRFREDWAHENGIAGVLPSVDWEAAARTCCVMTTRAMAGPVRVKIAQDSDVARLVGICEESGAGRWMWTLVVGG